MSVTIREVVRPSIAHRHGILEGDELLRINGNDIVDVLDYRYYMTAKSLDIDLTRSGVPYTVSLYKGEYEDLGLEFETYLMDKQHHCTNKCIFCFVDQMPRGMRESLYFKDDDSRLSFFFGNYITLTNMTEEEVDRIVKMKISPINISVHTTDPELRVKMMGSPKAASSLAYLRRLADGGALINTQLVLCPGINDGEHLRRSLGDLSAYIPSLQSIACVPVGLTDHRVGLAELRPFTPAEARETIRIIHEFAAEMEAAHGKRYAYPADEFFLKAGLPIPGYDYYGDFDQLENGVGLIAQLRQEFADALELPPEEALPKRRISLATGFAAAPLMEELAQRAMEQFPGLEATVYPIRNDFFGHNITVAGLVTGTDLLTQLEGRDLGETLLLPAVMFRRGEDVFLDGLSLREAEERLATPIRVVEVDGFTLLDAMLGIGQAAS